MRVSRSDAKPKTWQFDASLTTCGQAFSAGAMITRLRGASKGVKAYNTLQCGSEPTDHIHLHSDLVFVNHSCDPNMAFDLSSLDSAEWHIRALRSIIPGEQLTAFYPATEWIMDQAFDCNCGSERCLGRVEGASGISAEVLSKYWLNPWIVRLKKDQSIQPDRT